MPYFKVHGGDFDEGNGNFVDGDFFLRPPGHRFNGDYIPATELEILEIATEENVKRLGGTVGWGAAGAVLLGPVGLLAGLLVGGKRKEVTFIAKFKDGRKLLATTDAKTFTKIRAKVL
jgi:hypothetical protein